jgi:hypothetical protein
MKHLILTTVALCFMLQQTKAQDNDDKKPKKIVIDLGGSDVVNISNGDRVLIGKKKNKKNRKSVSKSLVFDLGFANVVDNTDYTKVKSQVSALTIGQPYQGVPGQKSAMALRPTKSSNVSISPFMYSFHLDKHESVNIITGLGFNFYNLTYENDLKLVPDSATGSMPQLLFGNYNNSIKKNKIAFDYLTAPLMLQLKPKVGKRRLVMGAGITAGYLLKSWHKVKLNNNDKNRVTQNFAASKWVTSLTGELGIDNKIRLYGNYSLNSIYEQPLDQNVFSFGIRFFGL